MSKAAAEDTDGSSEELSKLSYKFAVMSKLKRFRPFVSPSRNTAPVLPIGSFWGFKSSRIVLGSAVFARKRCPFFFRRPITYPRLGPPLLSNSTVYVL
jgi:hypothetical protein